MKNKNVLITGCSSGIGECVAIGLATRGYRVFATARKKEDVERLNQLGLTNLHSLRLDLDDSMSINNAVKEVLNRTDGELYALFNNGAYGQTGAIEDLSRDAFRAQFETNLFGWIELTNRILPVMRRQGYGRIIQNSSILGFISLPFRGPYNASKFALEGVSDALRLELAGSGIYVSLIEPGPVESRFRANAISHFSRFVDGEKSVHRLTYQRMLERLTKQGVAVPFTVPPEAVLKRVIHALESRSPRPRYYVTLPTYALGYLKRVVSTRMLDRILKLLDRP